MTTVELHRLGNWFLVSALVSYGTTLALGASSAVGSMLIGVLPGLLLHMLAERRARGAQEQVNARDTREDKRCGP